MITKLYNIFLNSDGVSTDTREDVNNKIFFALSGDNFNGNVFAKDALKKRAKVCVIDDPAHLVDERTILVPDVLSALQELATYHRKKNKAVILAITGSNGKTTTKELISQVLASSFDIISTKGNFNNHIGVPLTLLSIIPSTKIAIVEMGANHIGEIGRLCEIAMPDIGIITNIGKAHLEGFGSYEGVITAKNELYEYLKDNLGFAIVNNDDELLVKLSKDISQITYGINNANVEGEILASKPHLKLLWGYNNKTYKCNSRLYGNYNFYNIMAAITTGIQFNVPTRAIINAIESYIPQNNRSQQINTNRNNVVLDAYNANPFSMNEAIMSFANSEFENPWLLLGDMFELGSYSAQEHRVIIELLLKYNFKNVILIGNEFNKVDNHKYISFITSDDAIEYLKENKISNADILIKGSRGMKLERLLTAL